MSERKLTYLTTNPHKVREANHIFKERYGFEVQIVAPDFEVLEIQAKNSAEVALFSAEYASNILHIPCLKSDTSLYIDALGGLPGPYNAYFDKQIGVNKFLSMLKGETNRKARLEHCFAYCAPNEEPVLFSGGSTGRIALETAGTIGRWHDMFFIPDGETETLSQLRERDYDYETQFWGSAADDFAKWYINNKKD